MDIDTLSKLRDLVGELQLDLPSSDWTLGRSEALNDVVTLISSLIDEEDKAIDDYYRRMNDGDL